MAINLVVQAECPHVPDANGPTKRKYGRICPDEGWACFCCVGCAWMCEHDLWGSEEEATWTSKKKT